MNLVFEKLSQTLSAGQTWELNIAADFLRVESAENPVTVRLLRGGRILGQMYDWSAGDYVRGVEFDSIQIVSSLSNDVTIQIAGGGVGTDKVLGAVTVSGSVSISGIASVYDDNEFATKSGKAFSGYAASAVVAGNYHAKILSNPAGSNVDLVLKEVNVSTFYGGSTSNIELQEFAAGTGTFERYGKNNLLDGFAGASKSEIRDFKTTTFPANGAFWVCPTPAAVFVKKRFANPIIVKPGRAVGLICTGLGTGFYCTFEFEE